MRLRKMVLWAVLVSSVAAAGTGATAADALVWKFNGHELTGSEAIVGAASPGTLTVPGAPVTCGHVVLGFKIANTGGHAVGEMTEVPFYECSAGESCAVESIQAARLPWPGYTTTVLSVSSLDKYVVFEGVRIEIKYSGVTCPLSGILVVVKGTIGALFQSSTLRFNKASYEATKTGLGVGAEKAELDGTFPVEAFGFHRGETLELV